MYSFWLAMKIANRQHEQKMLSKAAIHPPVSLTNSQTCNFMDLSHGSSNTGHPDVHLTFTSQPSVHSGWLDKVFDS